MATTVFVDGITLTAADWFNDVDAITYDGAATEILVGGGAGSVAVWTTATGSGAPVRANAPTFTGAIDLSGATITGPVSASGAINGTTLGISGAITSTVGNNGMLFSAVSATTGYQYIQINNTGGALRIIQENSAGGTATGSTAYASLFGSSSNTPAQIISNNVVIGSFSSTGLAVTGTLSVSALPTSDPHVPGAFWRSTNTVMVSTG